MPFTALAKEDVEKRVKEIFWRIDLDGDGVITKDELRTAARTDDTIETLLDFNGEDSYADEEAALSRVKRFEEMFNVADGDSSNDLTYPEFRTCVDPLDALATFVAPLFNAQCES